MFRIFYVKKIILVSTNFFAGGRPSFMGAGGGGGMGSLSR